jgi:hypothetical protein
MINMCNILMENEGSGSVGRPGGSARLLLSES